MTHSSKRDESARRESAIRGLELAFAALGVAYRRYYMEAAETVSHGLTPSAFKTLVVINRVGPTHLSNLVHLLHSDKSLVSRHVTELERLGLIERTAEPTDARIRLIKVSRFGTERLGRARRPHLERLHRILANWPIEDIDKLAVLLTAISEE